MQNQVPLSPARVLYEELRENEDAGFLDGWPTLREVDEPAAAPDNDWGPAARAFSGLEDIPELTPGFAPPRSPTTSNTDPSQVDKVELIHAVGDVSGGDFIQSQSALAAIIRLQSTEIERLALDNDRLVERMDAVNQLIEDEQNRRRNLDQQLHEANLRNQPPAPALDVEEIRLAAREGMSAEIKPVLTAILDLLETALSRGAETMKPAAEIGGTPLSTSANLVAEAIDDIQRLPEILTRPIEELTSGSGDVSLAPAPVPTPAVDAPEQISLQETDECRPRPPHHKEQSSTVPSFFAWTNLFS